MTATSKPGKSRKFFAEMALHRAAKSVAGHLNEKLKKELGRRALPLRKGDTVKIMRGAFRGKEGKISKIERSSGMVYIEKIARKKSNGAEVEIAFDASTLLLIDIDRTDRKRLKRKSEKK